MDWSKSPPTEPGWYKIRSAPDRPYADPYWVRCGWAVDPNEGDEAVMCVVEALPPGADRPTT